MNQVAVKKRNAKTSMFRDVSCPSLMEYNDKTHLQWTMTGPS